MNIKSTDKLSKLKLYLPDLKNISNFDEKFVEIIFIKM